MWKVLLISALMAFVLSACDSNSEGTNTISVADLTERENAILSTTAEQSFVFDFHTDPEAFEELTVSVEKYKSGELVNDKLIYFSTEIQEEGSIIFAVSGMDGPGKQLFIHSGISSNGTVAMSRNETELPDENLSSRWGSNLNGNNPADGEMVLGSILYSSDESGTSSFPVHFDEEMEEHREKLGEYDVAFQLKAEFK